MASPRAPEPEPVVPTGLSPAITAMPTMAPSPSSNRVGSRSPAGRPAATNGQIPGSSNAQVPTARCRQSTVAALANGTRFGLVSGVWTADGGRQFRMARRIRSGQVFINNYGAGGGVELPFGGTGQSGHGREKGFEALYGFTTLKTIAIRHG
mgnify:CR=1 FL=1